jgi:outer membrane protein assembly factor BamE (lipoprotein component of BamABCDE complex)
MGTVLAGCVTAQEHRAAVTDPTVDRLTVGTVQREIHTGMSGADVAAALGAPNIVSTDDQGREQWIYDKIATERAYSASEAGAGGAAVGGGIGSLGLLGGLFGGSYGQSAGASSTSQRTLTIVVKFDADKRVRDVAYRQSSF